jgi:hypothetical protein
LNNLCRFVIGLLLCRFLGRLDKVAIRARRREASEKRQGTKSRNVEWVGAARTMGIWGKAHR